MKNKNHTSKTTITITEDVLIDLHCIKEFQEPMVDVIKRLIKSYAGVAHIDLDERRRFLINGGKPIR